MAKDYIPTSDLQLADWLDNFHSQLTARKAALNVPDSALAKLATAKDDFRNKMEDADAKKIAYETALEAEKEARVAAVAEARSLAQQAQREPNMTNADRTQLGLTVPDTKPTAPPVPNSFPVVTVDTSKRLRHGLKWNDSNTPTSRARPAGVAYTEIWRYIGATPPTDISQFNLIKIVTKTNHTVEYQSPDAGKTAYFNLRWVNSQDQPGPWSETISATIIG
jgi:hypothetical protein